MPTNDFLKFTSTDTGTNLLTQAEYLADAQRTIGNQPGVARSKLVNKAARQAAYVVSNLAQFLSERLGLDVLDDNTDAKLLSQMHAAFGILPPTFTRYGSGSGTHNLTYYFRIASGSATAGATYSHNAFTYTVVTTVASGTLLRATGTGFPLLSGTLTKVTGTGDATLTFYAARIPLYGEVVVIGGGAGGAGSNGSNSTGGAASSWGTSLVFTSTTGGSSNTPGSEGSFTINSPAIDMGSVQGGRGGGAEQNNGFYGLGGRGASGFGPGGGNGASSSSGYSANPNTGAGGGGASDTNTNGQFAGAGGSSNAVARAFLPTLLSSYAWAVGAGGTAGSSGGSGGSGMILFWEKYQ